MGVWARQIIEAAILDAFSAAKIGLCDLIELVNPVPSGFKSFGCMRQRLIIENPHNRCDIVDWFHGRPAGFR